MTLSQNDIQSKDILKELLLAEIEDAKTFNDDPMGFILKKYTSLNETMIELMTRAYREYVYGIYIVAPKPTTFKVVLHNNQYFFLTYMGPTYQATIAGKNYYLSDLGERERCIVAISKLLRGGSPIKTKGPAGAEKSAKDEEGAGGGGESGGESGVEGAESTSPEGGAAEGGETEELTENAKLILKLLLEQSIEEPKDKDSSEKPESSEKIKKKYRFPQTPIIQKGSLTPSGLGVGGKSYRSPSKIVETISSSLNNITGEDSQQVNKTKEFLLSLCEDVKTSEKSVKKTNDGDLEGGIDTINFSKRTVDALSGVNRKDLNTIGIEFGEILGALYLSHGLVAINKKGISFPPEANSPLYDFSISGINVSSKYKKGAASSLRIIVDENKKDDSKLTENAKKLLDTLYNSLQRSTSISYLYLAKQLNDPKVNEAFSTLNTEFGIDIDPSKDDDSSIKSTINNAILKFREQENGGEIVTQKLNSFYDVIGRRKIPEDKQPRWHQLPGGDKKDAKPSDITYYGLITSPMSYFLTDLINSKKDIKEGDTDTPYLLLKELIQNTKITQLRLNFALREKSARFSSQSSKSESAKFSFFPKVTANDPEKGVMSFRME